MIKITGFLSVIFLMCNLAWAELPQSLKNAFGTYQSIETKDYFCGEISSVSIYEPSGSQNDLLAEVLFNNGNVMENLIPGINTNKVYPVTSISSKVVKRYVFKNNQLKLQEKSSFAGFLSSGFKDRRVLLKIIDNNTIEYSYSESSTCTFGR